MKNKTGIEKSWQRSLLAVDENVKQDGVKAFAITILHTDGKFTTAVDTGMDCLHLLGVLGQVQHELHDSLLEDRITGAGGCDPDGAGAGGK